MKWNRIREAALYRNMHLLYQIQICFFFFFPSKNFNAMQIVQRVSAPHRMTKTIMSSFLCCPLSATVRGSLMSE